MYRFNAEDPGQSLYTPTTVGVIPYATYFHQFLIRVPFSSILNTNFFKCEMKCIVKVKTRIFKCTGLMPSDLGNPYIHSATALCDIRYRMNS